MKKKIVALLATIAAVLGFGFATSTAMAIDSNYGQTGIEGSGTVESSGIVSFSFDGLTPNGEVTVTADDNVVSDIIQVISRTFTADAQGNLSVKFILKDGVAPGTVVSATATDVTTGKTVTASATVPATGAGDTTSGASGSTSATGNTVAQTGAAVAPYVVAVVLLAAAGCAVFAARKAGTR